MLLLRILLLLCCCSSSFAEDKTTSKPPPNMIYNRHSQLTVQNINKMVEVLHDPSKMISGGIDKITSAAKATMAKALPDEKSTTDKTAAEELHDPTRMSGNFRQAIKSYAPANTTPGTPNAEVVLPTVTLIGKVIATNDPDKSAREQNQSSVALNVDGQVIHLKQGDSTSIFKNNQLFTLTVEIISLRQVKIRLQPSNDILIFN